MTDDGVDLSWRETLFEVEYERVGGAPYHRRLTVFGGDHPYDGPFVTFDLEVDGDPVKAGVAIALDDAKDVRELHTALGAWLDRYEQRST